EKFQSRGGLEVQTRRARGGGDLHPTLLESDPDGGANEAGADEKGAGHSEGRAGRAAAISSREMSSRIASRPMSHGITYRSEPPRIGPTMPRRSRIAGIRRLETPTGSSA